VTEIKQVRQAIVCRDAGPHLHISIHETGFCGQINEARTSKATTRMASSAVAATENKHDPGGPRANSPKES
jgi:hypothetical protein